MTITCQAQRHPLERLADLEATDITFRMNLQFAV
jgi:hypothetical protein